MAETSPVAEPVVMPALVQEAAPKRSRNTARGAALPFLGVALAAGSAMYFQMRKDKRREAASNMSLAELKAEREVAQKELADLKARFEKLLGEYSAVNASNQELLDAYVSMEKVTEELQARLGRSEAYNLELQMKVKRERNERARCERKIMQLQKKIEEQEAIMQMQKLEEDALSARSDDSAKELEEDNKKASHMNVPKMVQQRWVAQ